MNKETKLARIINSKSKLTKNDIIECIDTEPNVLKPLTNKLKVEYGKAIVYIGTFDYYNYEMTEVIDELLFKSRKQANRYEKELKRRFKDNGIFSPFKGTYEEEIAKKYKNFIKFGVTYKMKSKDRFKRTRRKKNWEEKPGFGECLLLSDRDTIIKIHKELKKETWVHPYKKFI